MKHLFGQISMSRMRGFIPSLLIIGLLASPLAARSETRHPQDGPHVDVQIRIESERVVVRLEMNLVFLDYIMDFQRETPEKISTVEFAALPEALDAFFTENHPVRIDGIQVLPTVERLQLNDPDLNLLPLFPVSGEQGLRKIRFELIYPTKQAPKRVDFEWTSFPPDILVVADEPPSLVIAAELSNGRIRTPLVFTKDEPGYTWHAGGDSIEERMMVVPATPDPDILEFPMLPLGMILLGGVVLVGGVILMRKNGHSSPLVMAVVIDGVLTAAATGFYLAGVGNMLIERPIPLPDMVQAEEIFVPLHANIYRAFDYEDESDIYDALAQSADGDFLDTLYRTIFRGLVMEEEGGAVARVARVTPLEVKVEDIGLAEDGRPAFQVTCFWQVDGVVTHWGHSHARSNQYRARWGVAETLDGWRLTGSELLEQDRLELDDDNEKEGWDDEEEFEI